MSGEGGGRPREVRFELIDYRDVRAISDRITSVA